MNTSSSHDDLDLLDLSDWNTNEPFDTNNFNHPNDDEISMLSDRNEDVHENFNDIRSTIRKSSNPPTVTTIYEPKFLEIFLRYRQYAAKYEPNINLQSPAERHLMALCLENLLPFANWARDSAAKAFICETLYDNPDMRPEVRNGLALILVYTFCAAKAVEEAEIAANTKANIVSGKSANIDMFSVLMKQDTGMGIVNKTSLKMYSDPLGYFLFIKVRI
jgi:hypothetical protein